MEAVQRDAAGAESNFDEYEPTLFAPYEPNEPTIGSSHGLPADSDGAYFDKVTIAEVDEQFKIGVWVELRSAHGWLQTQLTWVSPHNTLFMYTASDGSMQSMTRRIRDKMLVQDTLRLVIPTPVVARAVHGPARKAQA